MIKLRTVLLYNSLYITILVLVLIISIIRININKKELISTNNITIVDSFIDGNSLNLTLKSNHKFKGIYYFKTKEELNYYKNSFNLGDKISIEGTIKEIDNTNTKNIFNYKKYLEYKNIYYIVRIDSIKKISNTNNIYYLLKQSIINGLNNNPYLYTFILGDKRYLKQEIKETYQNNGISHLFAISGLHISLIGGIILYILKKLNIYESKRYFITSIILVLYLLLTGLSPSILRGVLFFILFSINRVYYFYIKSFNIFILILSISLLINPFYLYEVAFWYSFTISLTLILMSNYINKYNKYLKKLLITSLLSFIASLPITLYNFYQVNLLSIIYNLFYVPLVSIIIFPLSLLTYIFKFLEPIYSIFISVLETTSIYLNKINTFKLIFPKLNIIIYILYFIFIIIFFIGLNKSNKKYFIPLIMLIISHYLYPYINNNDYIKMIDVGQGDSFLLHSNNKTILIDTGGKMSFIKDKWMKKKNNSSIVKNITIPLLKSLGIKKIDYLILTHGDYDHLGETLTLMDNFYVDKVYINDNNINYLERKIIKKANNIFISKEGTNIKVGKFNLIELNTDLKDENDSSSVYYITYNNLKMLFTGDASIKSEEYILSNYNLGNIDILKLGHHGSKTSTSKELLKETNPKLALISCGRNNKFGHPHKEIINRLNKYNINYLRTDKLGTITINLNNKHITIGG
ncbi:MAG: DNA internalization-related competence protein ComEC/Rec2 [Bacilli bacterium]|nr:DNA internalization-related competence protein ComEC/Rec2 [Bacilli bacterium]